MKNTLRIRWYKTIQAKLILITMMVSTFILGCFAVFNIASTKATMVADLNAAAEITAQRLSKHLLTPLWDLDEQQVVDSLTAEMLDQKIFGIVVYETNGVMFKGVQRDPGSWTVLDSATVKRVVGEVPDLVKNSAEIVSGQDTLGRVDVYVSRVFMQRELIGSVISTIIQVAILDFALFVTLWFVARNVVVQPILELANSAERMSKGQLNVGFEVEGEDEIGHLADAFRRLQMSLRLAIKRLKQVSHRTAV